MIPIYLYKSKSARRLALTGALITAAFCHQSCFSPMSESDDYNPLPQLALSTRSEGSGSYSRLDLALFDAEGERVVKVNQKQSDATFGNPTFRLSPGDYQLVAIAHSGTGAATLTSFTEVTFPSNKVTDTFYYCLPVTVTDTNTHLEATLHRAVSMVRFIITDTDIPDEFYQLKLYYTGGSSTFSPSAGFGSVQSRQTEIRLLSEASRTADGYLIFEVYTFPHEATDELRITLTPQDADAQPLLAQDILLPSVPIQLNHITECEGKIFEGNPLTGTTSLTITVSDEWEGTSHITF